MKAMFKHYGTINHDGFRCYKVSWHDQANMVRAKKAGFYAIGRGTSYTYVTDGSPTYVNDPYKALPMATMFALKPDGQYMRLSLFNSRGLVHSSIRDTTVKPAEAIRSALIDRGLQEVSA